jgi:hypothetical protein
MVRSIVKQNDRVGPPLLVNGVEVLAELDYEKKECLPISLALIDSKEALTLAADASNDID